MIQSLTPVRMATANPTAFFPAESNHCHYAFGQDREVQLREVVCQTTLRLLLNIQSLLPLYPYLQDFLLCMSQASLF